MSWKIRFEHFHDEAFHRSHRWKRSSESDLSKISVRTSRKRGENRRFFSLSENFSESRINSKSTGWISTTSKTSAFARSRGRSGSAGKINYTVRSDFHRLVSNSIVPSFDSPWQSTCRKWRIVFHARSSQRSSRWRTHTTNRAERSSKHRRTSVLKIYHHLRFLSQNRIPYYPPENRPC